MAPELIFPGTTIRGICFPTSGMRDGQLPKATNRQVKNLAGHAFRYRTGKRTLRSTSELEVPMGSIYPAVKHVAHFCTYINPQGSDVLHRVRVIVFWHPSKCFCKRLQRYVIFPSQAHSGLAGLAWKTLLCLGTVIRPPVSTSRSPSPAYPILWETQSIPATRRRMGRTGWTS